jgi:hypothetical protein
MEQSSHFPSQYTLINEDNNFLGDRCCEALKHAAWKNLKELNLGRSCIIKLQMILERKDVFEFRIGYFLWRNCASAVIPSVIGVAELCPDGKTGTSSIFPFVSFT